METVICDTNIWYDIATNSIDTRIVENNHLIISQVNVQELCSSPRVLSKQKLFVDTCECIINYVNTNPTAICLIDPYNYISGIDYVDEDSRKAFRRLQMFVKNRDEVPDILKDNRSIQKKINVKNNKKAEEKGRLAATFQEKMDNFRKIIKLNDKNKIKEFRKENTEELSKQLFISTHFENQPINIDWIKHHFFLSVYDYWLNELITGARKSTANDWEDYLNFIYIEPGMKYWTHEKKWILAIWNSGMKNYLFIDDEVERILEKHKNQLL